MDPESLLKEGTLPNITLPPMRRRRFIEQRTGFCLIILLVIFLVGYGVYVWRG